MKRLFRLFVLGLSLSYAAVAQADYSTYLYEPDYEDEENKGAFNVEVQYDHIDKSKFNNKDLRGEKIGYSYGQLNGSAVFYYDCNIEEGAYVNLQYSRTTLRWKENPFFSQENFDVFSVGLGGFSNRLYNWEWKGQLNVNFDINHFDWVDYINYDTFLWGRYVYDDCIGLNIGIIAQTGMKIDWIYPILGVDWRINCRWKLNLVFPLNVSLVYSITDRWSIALAGRTFTSRNRVGKNAPLSRGLWTYRQVGAEIGVNYDHCNWLKFNVHAGRTFEGQLKVANRHYKHRHHLRFDGAFYFGGEASVNF